MYCFGSHSRHFGCRSNLVVSSGLITELIAQEKERLAEICDITVRQVTNWYVSKYSLGMFLPLQLLSSPRSPSSPCIEQQLPHCRHTCCDAPSSRACRFRFTNGRKRIWIPLRKQKRLPCPRYQDVKQTRKWQVRAWPAALQHVMPFACDAGNAHINFRISNFKNHT